MFYSPFTFTFLTPPHNISWRHCRRKKTNTHRYAIMKGGSWLSETVTVIFVHITLLFKEEYINDTLSKRDRSM